MSVTDIFASEIFESEEELEQFLGNVESLMRRGQPDVAATLIEAQLMELNDGRHDIAKLAQATPLLPEPVQRQGVRVRKSSSGFLLVIGLVSEDGRLSQVDLADYLVSTLVDPFSRIEGVGNIRVFGSQYAMRIWLDPSKLAAYELAPSDVVQAVSAQNAQISAGELGEAVRGLTLPGGLSGPAWHAGGGRFCH